MKFVVALLAVYLGIGSPAFAADPQPLSISVHGDGAEATRLPVYDPDLPVAVSVSDSAKQQLDAVSVVASGPQGASIRAPLSRGTSGMFNVVLSLHERGRWSLRLTTRSGRLTTDTTPVSLTVESPPPSNAGPIGLAVGAAIFIFIGGGGFLALRRIAAAPPEELRGTS